MRFKIFISSVQREFAAERQMIAEYVRKDALLGKFFDVFLFEEEPACDVEARDLYLPEVEKSDIYLGILGAQFGNADADGVSPTEREYDSATIKGKERLVFVKKCERDPREERFLQKVQSDVVRKSFETAEELQLAVYAALVRVLENKGYVRVAPFDLAVDTNLTLTDVDDAKVRDYLARAREAKKISVPKDANASWLLTKLGMIDSDGRLTNAGVLANFRILMEPLLQRIRRKTHSRTVNIQKYWICTNIAQCIFSSNKSQCLCQHLIITFYPNK